MIGCISRDVPGVSFAFESISPRTVAVQLPRTSLENSNNTAVTLTSNETLGSPGRIAWRWPNDVQYKTLPKAHDSGSVPFRFWDGMMGKEQQMDTSTGACIGLLRASRDSHRKSMPSSSPFTCSLGLT